MNILIEPRQFNSFSPSPKHSRSFSSRHHSRFTIAGGRSQIYIPLPFQPVRATFLPSLSLRIASLKLNVSYSFLTGYSAFSPVILLLYSKAVPDFAHNPGTALPYIYYINFPTNLISALLWIIIINNGFRTGSKGYLQPVTGKNIYESFFFHCQDHSGS